MRKFGLIGYPLSHSFSKKYFTEKFKAEGIFDCEYDLYAIPTVNELPALLEQQPDLVGLNVTIPYKKQVIQFLNDSTEAVKQMQACNCIRIQNGKLFGFNTDIVGFEKTFAPHLNSSHKRALILGTGGAAAAVEFTLKKLNIDYLFVSRKQASNAITYEDLDEEIINHHTVIINTTPLGTSPDIQSCPEIPYQYLTVQHYLYDLVYNPAETLFLIKGKERGATIQNGAEMLVIQAEESWKIWNDGK